MAFHKGKPKTGGRKPGTPNKTTVEVKEFARSILEGPLYQKRLRDRVMQGKAPQIEVLLFHYAYGKPKEHFSVERGPTMEELVSLIHANPERKNQPEALHTEVWE
jgi:hypothetical protein